MTNEVMAAAHMLRVGNVFIKFSQNGPPHDRWVWISPNMTELAWADPERKKKGNLKSDAVMKLSEVSAVVQGVKSELLKHEKEKV